MVFQPDGAVGSSRGVEAINRWQGIETLDAEALGRELHGRIERLYSICRSITGDGLRQTLRMIADEIPLETEEVQTGTSAFDWTVPKEWNIRDAYIKDAGGNRVVDFRQSNLHVVGYSTPVHAFMSADELRPHLHAIPEHPDWIPYKTSYYAETWGFCVTGRQVELLSDGQYEVCIDSSLEAGSLTLAQCVLPGRDREEILISTHTCHPSLCNDNLSGISVAVTLARLVSAMPHRYTYRFVFAPTTIGSIVWLSRHLDSVDRIKHGLVLACVGDRGGLTYKRSRQGTATIDRAVVHVLHHDGGPHRVKDFSPYGYDERQYGSPGFNLPVGSLTRTPNGCFPEYHTSADDLAFVDAAALAGTLTTLIRSLAVIEGDGVYVNQSPHCEPQLGKRGLFGAAGGYGVSRGAEVALLWVLNLSDGQHSLLDVAEQSGLSFFAIRAAADALVRCDLLKPSAD
jgi:aminopeptidase-like protein